MSEREDQSNIDFYRGYAERGFGETVHVHKDYPIWILNILKIFGAHKKEITKEQQAQRLNRIFDHKP